MAIQRKRGKVETSQGVSLSYRELAEFKSLTTLANTKSRALRSKIERFNNTTTFKDIRGAGDIQHYNFELRKHSTSLNQFRSKREFNYHMDLLRRQVSGQLLEARMYRLKKGYEEAIRKNFGSDGEALIKDMWKMSDRKFYLAVQNKEFESVGYVYFDRTTDRVALLRGQLDRIKAS